MKKNANSTPSLRKQSGRKRVLAAMKHSIVEGRYDGGMLPSYRQLTQELNVSKTSVQRAMAELEREGLIRRERGRGVLPQARQRSTAFSKPVSLRCINFVFATPNLSSFIEADYLTGYTGVVEHLDVRTRFVAEDEVDSSPERLFSPSLPVESQGVVFINIPPAELVEWIGHSKVPFVVQYYARYDLEDIPPHFSVYVNKSGGAFQAVNHLLNLGHRNIGFIGSIASSFPSADTVFEGYRAGLVCAGLGCSENNIINYDRATREKETIFAIAKAFLDRPDRPTAVLTACDDFALALLKAAHALNLRVPKDLSVVGFDNQPGAEQTCPPLTTVSVPRRELARSAVELLLEAAEGPHVKPRMSILETHLIIRETTAPPPHDT